MTSEVGVPAWRARYPDLAGRVAVVSGEGEVVPAVVAALAASGMALAVVGASRATVDDAVASAEANEVAVFGVVADPHAAEVWGRVLPHAEQRLGPIDVLVAIGASEDRQAAVRAVTPDMGARRRGVVVEVGDHHALLSLPDAVRHRIVSTVGEVEPDSVGAAVAFCASDVVMLPLVAVELATS
ncbi:MAG TPA: hypothetical protein VG899_17320 [Mycobacteriales bacterium]|nr:hypothetical protein [Mycobacteriales bacterium]